MAPAPSLLLVPAYPPSPAPPGLGTGHRCSLGEGMVLWAGAGELEVGTYATKSNSGVGVWPTVGFGAAVLGPGADKRGEGTAATVRAPDGDGLGSSADRGGAGGWGCFPLFLPLPSHVSPPLALLSGGG